MFNDDSNDAFYCETQMYEQRHLKSSSVGEGQIPARLHAVCAANWILFLPSVPVIILFVIVLSTPVPAIFDGIIFCVLSSTFVLRSFFRFMTRSRIPVCHWPL